MKTLRPLFVLCLVWMSLAPAAEGQVDARMLRYPDVSETHIAFVYAGDIWIVPKQGGTAHRLSSPRGEETFPRFSPDGTRLAFSGNYAGNEDLYVVPAMGGPVERVTHHPLSDRMLDWFPDGETLLYASSMESGRQRFRQLYRIPMSGGLPEKLPLAYGEFGTVSPDGKRLAFMTKSRDFRTWKRYRGGWAPDIWLYDFETGTATNLTDHPANDSQPMWHGRTLYFLSDRGPEQRYNIWAHDLDRGTTRQVTRFENDDIHFPGIGPSDLVFEAGGRLYRFDLATEEYDTVPITLVTDQAGLQPTVKKVTDLIENTGISPSGKRAVIEARGEIFTLPAEHGPALNLTHSSGAAERYPSWSPDGKWIACFSDRSGEYELTLRPADGTGEETTLTSMGAGFRYQPVWSPDSQRLAFIDHAMTIRIYDRPSKELVEVDKGKWMNHGALQGYVLNWSPDSRWLAYAGDLDNENRAIFLFDSQNRTRHQVTAGYYNDNQPVFDPDGDYLYFYSDRNLRPVYSDLDNTWVYPNATQIVAVPLTRDTPSPLAPRNDMEGEQSEDEKAKEEKDDEKENGDKKDTDEKKKAEPVRIDLEGFEERAVILPPVAGNFGALAAAEGKVVFHRRPISGSAEDAKAPLIFYDLEERKEKTILDDVAGFQLAAGGEKLLVRQKKTWAIVDLAPEQKLEKTLATDALETTVDPVAEWTQIFNDAWRVERDYFYDPNMHGLDWNAVGDHYRKLLDDAVTRWDVNFVIGEMIAELGASHAYRGGGDQESPEERGAGLLGVDWTLENGAYRIARIIEGASWDTEIRSPLREAGINVGEGSYVLQVNGRPLDPMLDPWAGFDGTAGKPVILTVNSRPEMRGARNVVVKTLTPDQEQRLRHLAWIESNRKRVDEATGGRVGYIYVPNTGIEGQTELVRQFRAQFRKDGLIIDERFNSGGQIPDRFVELLDRPPLAYWGVRHGPSWQWPPIAHFGPKVMLINGWSGSGGDAFPDYFRRAGLGPLIGERTWGGLIGISGNPQPVDGGGVTVPTFRMYLPGGEWFREGHGVEPDIDVKDDPALLARGTDTQLEKAIEVVTRLLEDEPYRHPDRPEYEDRKAIPRPR